MQTTFALPQAPISTGVPSALPGATESPVTASSTTPSTAPSTHDADVVVLDQLLNSLVGVWKLQKSDNFDNYLKAQGVGCIARTLVGFLDLSITISKRRNGLRVWLRVRE